VSYLAVPIQASIKHAIFPIAAILAFAFFLLGAIVIFLILKLKIKKYLRDF